MMGMNFDNRNHNSNEGFELRKILRNRDEYTFEARFRRLKYLADIDSKDSIPALDGLTPHYREEAGRCYEQGNFVAAIVMVNLTFDSLLRSIFRYLHHTDEYTLKNE